MLQWNDGTWEHRAYWGANVHWLGYGRHGESALHGCAAGGGAMGAAGGSGGAGGIEGRTLNGMAYTLYGGRASWDYAGK